MKPAKHMYARQHTWSNRVHAGGQKGVPLGSVHVRVCHGNGSTIFFLHCFIFVSQCDQEVGSFLDFLAFRNHQELQGIVHLSLHVKVLPE